MPDDMLPLCCVEGAVVPEGGVALGAGAICPGGKGRFGWAAEASFGVEDGVVGLADWASAAPADVRPARSTKAQVMARVFIVRLLGW
ncbi:hypothetical protein J2732_000702 [Achromobacter deleyi]|nr:MULTISPECIES: hypothetical protein [Achromobacter]MDR6599719.1 hypothetical protein [Achromobacter deleyi]